LDEDVPTGELAVMWGVLHHLKDREGCLKRIKKNYSLIFVREPLRNSIIKGLELGHPIMREEIERLVEKHLPDAQVFYHGNSIFTFYESPELDVSH